MRVEMKLLLFAPALALLGGRAAFAENTLEIGAVVREFYVKDVTGPAAGTELCYRCRYGNRPVVAVFTRQIDDNLTTLVRELNDIVGSHADHEMAGFVVLMTDEPATQEEALKALAEKHEITHLPLTIFEDELGPRAYRISREADVTVMMWVGGLLVVNETFNTVDLRADTVEGIVAATGRILN